MDAELRQIDARRRQDLSTYFRGPDPARELELLEARERLQGGARAAGDSKPNEVAAIDKELAEIQAVMRSDRPRYERELAGRHLDLLAEKERLDAGSTSGLPPEVLTDWRNTGGVKHHLKVAQDTARVAFDALEGQELAEFQRSFDALPEAVIAGVYRHIGVEPGFAKPARDAAVTEFAEIGGACADLVSSWGPHASKRLGVAQSRVNSILKGLPASERTAALEWMDAMPASQQAAVIAALAAKGR